MSDVTRILSQIDSGDPHAAEQLLPLVYDELRRMAARQLASEVAELVGDSPEHVLRISAKTGHGVAEALDAIVERVPAPSGRPDAPPRALIFDSSYDQYRGVVAFVRVVDGTFSKGDSLRAMAAGTEFDAEELGFLSPAMVSTPALSAGEVGYLVTGDKPLQALGCYRDILIVSPRAFLDVLEARAPQAF